MHTRIKSSAWSVIHKISEFSFLKTVSYRYKSLFAIEEIGESPAVRYSFVALLITLLSSFELGILDPKVTVESFTSNTHLCWPYFLNCGSWYFLHAHPYGYSYNAFSAFVFILIFISGFSLYKRWWGAAHVSALIVWIIKTTTVILFTQQHTSVDYYEIILGVPLLFLPHKLYFTSLTFVWLYFAAAIIKFHPSWIVGTYFTSLKNGLPLVPSTLVPIATNLIILFQCIEVWFLLSANKTLQNMAFWWSLLFHIYSVSFVGYRFPTATVPFLISLFGPLYIHTKTPIDRKSILGWFFLLVMSLLQFVPVVISGDHKLTLEGNHYALHLFEANHQCITSKTIHFLNGTTASSRDTFEYASNRCYPYREWFRIHEICTRDGNQISNITWTFDHSINGGPFYRIVDTQNACELTYKPFGHNDWIQLPESGAVPIGIPVKNYYDRKPRLYE